MSKMMNDRYNYNGLFITMNEKYLIEAFESEQPVVCEGCPNVQNCTWKIVDEDNDCCPGSVNYTIYEILYDKEGVARALFEVDGGLFGYCNDTDEEDFFNFIRSAHEHLPYFKRCEGNIKKTMEELLDRGVVA